MAGSAVRIRGAGSALGAIVLAGLFLGLASCGTSPRAARPAQPIPAPPEAYAGSEACQQCHKAEFAKFGTTKMGRLFLHQPRNTGKPRLRELPRPGQAHVEAGEKGKGGMITFAKNDPTPIEQRTHVPHLPYQGRACSGRAAPTTRATWRARAATG